MNVGFISLWDLYQMHKEMGHRFFDKNIRAGLSTETAPNKSIRSSLKSIIIDEKENPETFTFKHNGVTIAVEDLIIDDNNSATMIEPRILNGAQTVTNFKHFYETIYKDHPAIEKNSDKIKMIKLLAKIINAQDKTFITNITICNNKQNPVEPWNLHANDDIQVALEDMFKFKINNSMGIGYERLENYYTNMSDDDLENEGIQGGKKIEILTLAKTFLAVKGEVDKMSRISDVFENEKEYHSTFHTGYLDGKPQRIVLGYKIVFRLELSLEKLTRKPTVITMLQEREISCGHC
jgi:hypothetical protein